MVQVEFLKIKNQVNKRVNPNSNLPWIKKKMFAQIIWCSTERFQIFSEDNFAIVTYRIVWNPAITTDRNVLFFWCFSERKALIRPLMINKFFVNWSFVIGCLTVGGKTPSLITTLNVMGAFLVLFFTYPWIFNPGNLPRESLFTHTNTISGNSRTGSRGVSCQQMNYLFKVSPWKMSIPVA